MSNEKFFPKKSLGQNFLRDKNILKKIIEAGEIEKKDTILEIGAGFGNLTEELKKRAKKILAIEKDKRLVKVLKEKFKDSQNIEIIEGDVRDVLELITEKLGDYKIIGNIPYYLTSFLLRKIFELEHKPKLIVFLVQKEVAQRIVAKPPKMNLLALSVQFFGKPEILHYVSKNCFWPKPKVDSAILRVKMKEKIPENPELFFRVVKAGFLHPRKKLSKNLEKGLKLNKEFVENLLKSCKIKVEERAENLTFEDWLKIKEKLELEK